jgi:hypothetical protein
MKTLFYGGERMDYGELFLIEKGKRYCGKSEITHKALYRVMYSVYFYKDGEKRLGFIKGKEFTFEKSFKRKSELNNFLRELGRDDLVNKEI